jgi:hypothetical protein
VLCILWHAGRLLDLACCILLPRIAAPKRWAAEACAAAVVVILFMAWPMPHSGGAPTVQSSRTVSVLGPIGSTLRSAILFGFDFAYDPAMAGDLSETAIEPLLPRPQPRL